MPYNSLVARGTGPTYSATAGTHPLIPEDVQHEIVKAATQKSAAGSLFKQRRMSRLETRIPVLNSKPTAYFVTGDTGLKQTTTMDWTNVFLDAQEIACIVPIPINLVEDVDYNLWDEIRPEVEEAIAVTLDAAIFFGTGKPSVWPAAIAPQSITAGNTVTQGAGVDIAADLNNVLGAVEADGYTPNGIFMRQSVRSALRGLRSTTNEFIFLPSEPGVVNTTYQGTLFGLKAVASLSGIFEAENAATANSVELIAGDYSQAILGVREDVKVEFFREGIIQDATGAIQYNLLQQDMVAGRFVCRYAFAVPNPINRINQTAATRYPFAVLRDAA